MKRKLFLIEVFGNDKMLLVLFTGFILFQAFFIYKGVETIPFFHWGMYSAKKNAGDGYHRTSIQVNGKEMNLIASKQIPSGYLFSILDYYAELKRNNFHDPILEVIDHRFSDYIILKNFAEQRLANDSASGLRFRQWLCDYLNNNGEHQNGTLVIKDIELKWNGTKMIKVDSATVDSFMCLSKYPYKSIVSHD